MKERIVDYVHGLVGMFWKCMNCARQYPEGPITALVPVTARPLGPVGRWSHNR